MVDVRDHDRSGDHEIGHLELVADALLCGGLGIEETAMRQNLVLVELAALAVQDIGAGLLDHQKGAGGGVAVFGRHRAADYLDFLIADRDGIDGGAAVHGGGQLPVLIGGGLPVLAAIEVEIAQ